MSDPFIAEIRIVGLTFAPYGWAFCDGRTMQIVQNQALYALIGNYYGGDGRTTFCLPDLRGRVPMAAGSGPGLTPRTMAQMVGAETVTLTTTTVPGHTHTAKGANGTGAGSPEGNTWGKLPGRNPPAAYQSGNPNVPMASSALGTVGQGQAHDNLQPYLALNFVIALMGIFPARD